MIKESNLVGSLILNEKYEELNYEIKNIIYYVEKFQVLGFYLGEISSEKLIKILPYTKMKNITDRGIIINSIDDMVNIDEISEMEYKLNDYKPIIGYEIYSNNNEIIGVVKDVLIQIKSGKILGFIMSEGIINDLVNGYSFLPISEDISFDEYKILLKEEIKLKIIPQQGGLKKILGIDKEK